MADRHEINKEEMFRKIMPSAAVERDAAPEAQSGGMMSQDAIAAAFAAAQGAAEPEPAPSTGGTMSEDAIAAAFAAAQGAADPAPAQEQPSEAAGGNGFMSEDAIAAAFAAANGEAPPQTEGTSSGGNMSEDAIAAAFAAAQNGSAATPEAAEEIREVQAEPVYEPEMPESTGAEPAFSPDGHAPHPVNLMEYLVDKYYPIYLERLDGCTCQRCRDDVSGITLNKIPPRYVTSEELDEVEAANREMVTETVTALVKALFIVKRNPHHGEQAAMRR